MKLVELEPGDILVIRTADSERFNQEEFQHLMDAVGLDGIIFLGSDDALTALTDDVLAELGLQRVSDPRCTCAGVSGVHMRDCPRYVEPSRPACEACGHAEHLGVCLAGNGRSEPPIFCGCGSEQ